MPQQLVRTLLHQVAPRPTLRFTFLLVRQYKPEINPRYARTEHSHIQYGHDVEMRGEHEEQWVEASGRRNVIRHDTRDHAAAGRRTGCRTRR